MRPIVFALSLALVAGCGSGGGDDPLPLFGGFTVEDTAAVIMTPGTCSVAGISMSVAGVALVFTSHPAGCEVLQTTHLCGAVADAKVVGAMAIQGDTSGTVTAVTPGTFSFMARPPSGPFRALDADADDVGPYPECQGLPEKEFTGGSMTLSAVSAERIAGSVSARFEDEFFERAFDVAPCPVTVDLCGMLTVGGCLPWEAVCIDPATLPTTG